MPLMVKARKDYTCHKCQLVIQRGRDVSKCESGDFGCCGDWVCDGAIQVCLDCIRGKCGYTIWTPKSNAIARARFRRKQKAQEKRDQKEIKHA